MKTILLFLVLLTPTLSSAQQIIPGKFSKTEICYKKDLFTAKGTWNGFKHTCEKFKAPEVIFDNVSPVKYIERSPRDPSRDIFKIPTFPLAIFHWWLFDVERERSQQQYAECVSSIALCQEFLGEYPLLTDPVHPFHSTMVAIRNYTVPFNPINPQTLEQARANADAATGTVNFNVLQTSYCKQTLAIYKARVFQKLQKGK